PLVKKSTRNASKKRLAPARGSRAATSSAGRDTLQEILSQPATWLETARQFEQSGSLHKIAETFAAAEPWLFVACGSSYYLAQTIASQWAALLKTNCTAAPASELLFAPHEVMRRTGARQVVLVSRSGKTTEVLRAAEWLKANMAVRTLGVTCNES